MRPLISIIMAVKDGMPYLQACINSILSQTFTNFELLCIYDASVDSTWMQLKSYCHKDSRVALIYGNSQGPGAARNIGISLASGKYWIFLDADDVFSPTLLEEMCVCAERTQSDIVVCRSLSLDSLGRVTDLSGAVQCGCLPTKVMFSPLDGPSDFFDCFVGWAWDKFFRASFCMDLQLRFGDNYILEDAAFVYPALANANRITVLKTPLVIHRIHKNSLEASSQHFNQHWKDIFINARYIQKKIREKHRYEHIHPYFCRWFLNYYLWAMRKMSGDSFEEMRTSLLEFETILGISAIDLKNNCYVEDYYAYKRLSDFSINKRFSLSQKNAVWKIRQLKKAFRYFTEGSVFKVIRHLY